VAAVIGNAMLHAQSLSFIDPATNEKLKFSAPHPADFEEALKILGPAPSSPNRLSNGTTQSSRMTSPIGDVRRPIFSMFRLTLKPGVPLSTKKAVTPPLRLAGSTVAKTRARLATGAFVTNIFVPLRT